MVFARRPRPNRKGRLVVEEEPSLSVNSFETWNDTEQSYGEPPNFAACGNFFKRSDSDIAERESMLEEEGCMNIFWVSSEEYDDDDYDESSSDDDSRTQPPDTIEVTDFVAKQSPIIERLAKTFSLGTTPVQPAEDQEALLAQQPKETIVRVGPPSDEPNKDVKKKKKKNRKKKQTKTRRFRLLPWVKRTDEQQDTDANKKQAEQSTNKMTRESPATTTENSSTDHLQQSNRNNKKNKPVRNPAPPPPPPSSREPTPPPPKPTKSGSYWTAAFPTTEVPPEDSRDDESFHQQEASKPQRTERAKRRSSKKINPAIEVFAAADEDRVEEEPPASSMNFIPDLDLLQQLTNVGTHQSLHDWSTISSKPATYVGSGFPSYSHRSEDGRKRDLTDFVVKTKAKTRSSLTKQTSAPSVYKYQDARPRPRRAPTPPLTSVGTSKSRQARSYQRYSVPHAPSRAPSVAPSRAPSVAPSRAPSVAASRAASIRRSKSRASQRRGFTGDSEYDLTSMLLSLGSLEA